MNKVCYCPQLGKTTNFQRFGEPLRAGIRDRCLSGGIPGEVAPFSYLLQPRRKLLGNPP